MLLGENHEASASRFFARGPQRGYIINMYVRVRTYVRTARGLTFARHASEFNAGLPFNLLSCFRACFSNTANMQNIVFTCASLHFCAYLRRCQNYLLKNILKTSSVICSVSIRWLKLPQTARLWKNPKMRGISTWEHENRSRCILLSNWHNFLPTRVTQVYPLCGTTSCPGHPNLQITQFFKVLGSASLCRLVLNIKFCVSEKIGGWTK